MSPQYNVIGPTYENRWEKYEWISKFFVAVTEALCIIPVKGD